ncbi:MAG: type VI secretion protein IcmF/TssM N-terminal domain-containing protein [Desulfobacteraceae bacterium]|jgi:type VI secretion system protein ImpL
MYNFKLAKLLKILLVTALVVLCVMVIWAVVLYVLSLEVQWWAKAMILACLAASILIAVLVRKLIQKRREMKFVDGIIGPDEMPGNISALSEASRELRRRFKQAVSTLKKSHLKHKGNPLYVLPWYLVVGRSGAGKSTAIKSARLTSPFGDFNRVAGIEGTRNCDWWFFDDSVVIDIAGRYSVHRNEELDKKEWQTFLEHLVRYRKKEPINGVIVTVEADLLLEGDLEKTEEEGQILRKRIDEITSVMGAKFPVYLMVTKADLIYGVERCFRLLSKSSVSQAMGLMNHDGETDIPVFVNKTIDTITEKLKDIRLIMANDEKVVGRYAIEPEVLLFPDEFSRLRGGLTAFCNGAFKDNPFQELPFLRGIYFGSGCQTGRPVNSLADSLGKMGSHELAGTQDGYFLYDFFAKILPSDRSLYSMTTTARQWHRLTHNLWLTGFVTIVLVFCILATYSWNANRAIVNSVSPKYKKAVLFNDDPIDDIGVMADFSMEIKAVEARNRDWKIPRLGLNASLELEQLLKKRYCQRFKDHFDVGINQNIESKIANGGWMQNDYAPAIRFIPFVVRRINMIKGKFDGADAEQLAKLPAPNFAMMLHGDKLPSLEQEIADRYKYAYINYLIWQEDIEALNITLVGLQRLLQNYFHENQGDLQWLIGWANENIPDQAIGLNKFWRSDMSDAALPQVEPAYTAQGHTLIGDFVLNELEKAVEQPLWIVKPKEQFITEYKNAYYGSWADFALNFTKAKMLFPDPDQWRSVIERFSTDDSPYMGLLETMEKQLLEATDEKWPSLKVDDEKDQRIQSWLAHVRDFGMIRKAAASDAVAGNKDVANELSRRVSHRTKIAAKLAAAGMGESKLARGKQAYKLYQDALQGFEGIASSRKLAYSVAKAGFQDDPSEAKSALFTADRAVEKIRVALTPQNGPKPGTKDDPFWCLIVDPVDELWAYSVQQAGGHLQYLWDREVLVKTEGISDRHQLGSLLFGDQGYADKFISNHAGPFVERSSRRGYHSKKMRGCAIPFKKSYFSFMKSGKRWLTAAATRGASNTSAKSHVVTVAAFPTDVNIEARIKPHMTRLVIEGANGDDAVLENRQYPIEKKFIWTSGKNRNVTLQIMLGDITLTRKYTGRCAFCNFVRDFRNGKHTFTVNDFPAYRNEFVRLGVNTIEVVYRFQHGQIAPILRELNKLNKIDITPGRPPGVIISALKTG